MEPIRDFNVYWVFFYIFLVMVCAYLAISMFIGVITDNYGRVRAKKGGEIFLTPSQLEWKKTREFLNFVQPLEMLKMPESAVASQLFRFSRHPYVETIFALNILLSVATAGCVSFGQSDTWTETLTSLQIVCSIIFIFDFITKCFVLCSVHNSQIFFRKRVNWIDLASVALCDVFVLINNTSGTGSNAVQAIPLVDFMAFVNFMRLLRLPRVYLWLETMNERVEVGSFSLIKRLFGPFKLVKAAVLILPNIINVCMFLFVFLFVFATMGMQLFSKVGYHNYYNETHNFRSFDRSFLLTIILGTLSNWNYLMHDLAQKPAGCDPDPEYDPDMCGFSDHNGCVPLNGCGTELSIPYFCVFVLIVSFVIFNLFVGVVLESYNDQIKPMMETIPPKSLEDFTRVWSEFDPQATYFINIKDLSSLICRLSEPLGVYSGEGSSVPLDRLNRKLARIAVRIFSGNRVHFKDVLFELSADIMKISMISKTLNGDEEKFDAQEFEQQPHEMIPDEREYRERRVKTHEKTLAAMDRATNFILNGAQGPLKVPKKELVVKSRTSVWQELQDQGMLLTFSNVDKGCEEPKTMSPTSYAGDDITVAYSSSSMATNGSSKSIIMTPPTLMMRGAGAMEGDDDYTIATVNSFKGCVFTFLLSFLLSPFNLTSAHYFYLIHICVNKWMPYTRCCT